MKNGGQFQIDCLLDHECYIILNARDPDRKDTGRGGCWIFCGLLDHYNWGFGCQRHVITRIWR